MTPHSLWFEVTLAERQVPGPDAVPGEPEHGVIAASVKYASTARREGPNSPPARPTCGPTASPSGAARTVPFPRTAPYAKYCRRTAATATANIAFRTNPAP